jgi:hypothetical protein
MPTFHFTKKSFVISVLCTLFIVTAAGWVFTGYLVGMATRIVERELENANAVISINLTSELKRIESAAVAIAGSPLTSWIDITSLWKRQPVTSSIETG